MLFSSKTSQEFEHIIDEGEYDADTIIDDIQDKNDSNIIDALAISDEIPSKFFGELLMQIFKHHNYDITHKNCDIPHQCMLCYQSQVIWECQVCGTFNKKEIGQLQCNKKSCLHQRKVKFDSTLLVFGYVRKIEMKCQLFITIPNIYHWIIKYMCHSAKLFGFGDHNKNAHTVTENGTVFRGNIPNLMELAEIIWFMRT